MASTRAPGLLLGQMNGDVGLAHDTDQLALGEDLHDLVAVLQSRPGVG
jgi:hypothetical protein